ncbi:MAG: cytochrome c biogenesis protein CcsA [Verrucomicrobia bacterium]|jgi:cytochrome c-type biogenesis protein CcsB|nr:cytochrome c biogenesis protein CcsA [Verrucomicrobiota bacterium]
MKSLFKILPWFFLALFGTEVLVVMLPKKDGEFHAREFGSLPVLLNGRIQPFDSVGRNALLQIRSTGDLPLEPVPSWQFWHHPKKLRSTGWLLEVFFKPQVADTRPIFLIHHPDLISGLKLGDKGVEKSGLRYYTFNDIKPRLDEISAQGRQAGQVEDPRRTTYQKQVLKLANAVILYQRLKNSMQPEDARDFAKTVEDYKASLSAGVEAFRAQQAGRPADKEALDKLSNSVRTFDQLANFAYPLVVPPLDPDKDRNAWSNVGNSLVASIQTDEIHPAVSFFARMASAYAKVDAAEFNRAVAGYKTWLAPKFSKETTKGRAEFYFNQVKAFLHATIIYICALVLAGGALLTFGAWPNLSESLRRSAFYLIALAFVVHTFGLIYRMALEGRPPVTNLYSSAIFIGWGACGLGLVLERIYKVGLGSAVAGLAGFVTLLIAHNLALGGDTMEMMRAVLDTNFWLATHVVTITLGYAATFVAGTLAMAYIAIGLFTPLLGRNLGARDADSKTNELEGPVGRVTPCAPQAGLGHSNGAHGVTRPTTQGGEIALDKALTKMVYAIVCFATLFSFTGTVLGGIWADQSWGRFWGWDPKENGALLIVIWNALILHARRGGLVRERGLMNLAIFGNIVTAFSWFGVNMLGIGLHSYGFMDSAFKWLTLFIGSQVAFIILGMLPLRLWKSFQARTSDSPTPKGPVGGDTSPAPAST